MCASSVRVPQEILKQGIQAGLYDDIGDAVGAVWGGPLFRPRAGLLGRMYRGTAATVRCGLSPSASCSYDVLYVAIGRVHCEPQFAAGDVWCGVVVHLFPAVAVCVWCRESDFEVRSRECDARYHKLEFCLFPHTGVCCQQQLMRDIPWQSFSYMFFMLFRSFATRRMRYTHIRAHFTSAFLL